MLENLFLCGIILFMRRIKLTIEYMGTNFCGYQIQPEKRSVQGELERILKNVLSEDIKTFASGRTDAGVHALGQVVHFDTTKNWKPERILASINLYLPQDISIISAEEVDSSFDARFNSHSKTYGLRFYLSRYTRPHLVNRSNRVNDNVDVSCMAEACKYFIGMHDFKSFVARKSGKTDFVRTIYSAKIHKINDEEYEFEVCGNGFLYNMVRIMFGTLLMVGTKRIKPEDVKKIIDSKMRNVAGKTEKPEGLYLKSVKY